MMFSDQAYDVIKWIAQLLLPALGTLWLGLADLWGIPYREEIVGTLMVIDAFLGVILGISSASYKKNKGESDDGQR